MTNQDPDRDKRLADIERRIEQMQARQNQEEKKADKTGLPAGVGAIMGRVATELVAGVIVGAFIGWMLDKWLETSPLFLVLMFFSWRNGRHAECLAYVFRPRSRGRVFR
jgi:ATP synthase protein I